ncbi:MAG: metallophosphoesterase family protein [Gemmatimonadaceae bacterium]|nr:metallophosphoesterase family protein [Gloeobacterales cyanobacterium ES-bin-141]
MGNSTAGTRVGLISDTHGLLRPEALGALRGSDLIIHAGDIGKPEVLKELRTLAPVIAVRGNNDTGPWAAVISERESTRIEGVTVYVLHILPELDLDPEATDIRVVISGHSHKPSVQERGGVLFINPGSAGPRRFKLPVSVAHLYINGSQVSAQVEELLEPASKAIS